MYKWVYDRMVEEYMKEEKIELIHEIMSYSNIEVSDRCFANQCCAGADVYNINALFELLEKREFKANINTFSLFVDGGKS